MFLTVEELKTRANIEIIDAITQNDDTVVEMIISESIALMKGYLSARFDVASIFSHNAPPAPEPVEGEPVEDDPIEDDPVEDEPVEDDPPLEPLETLESSPEPEPEPPVSEPVEDDLRDPVVLKILKDIVIYEVYAMHNPNIVSEIIEKNMDRALNWLEAVQACKVNPDLPKHPVPNEIKYIISGSNPQRSLHY